MVGICHPKKYLKYKMQIITENWSRGTEKMG